MLEIVRVRREDAELVQAARALFQEYETELQEDLCFQSFEQELAELPGKYAPPRGALLLGRFGEEVVACGALRPSGEGIAELKRLYVKPLHRRYGFGKDMTLELIAVAKELGYRQVRLDTLARLVPALLLYHHLGFKETVPYYQNPLPGVIYLSLDIDGPTDPAT